MNSYRKDLGESEKTQQEKFFFYAAGNEKVSTEETEGFRYTNKTQSYHSGLSSSCAGSG